MKPLALATVLATSVAVVVAAQSPVEPSAQPVFRSGASLVALNVTVTDADKRYVTGLRVDDFAVYENGIQQDVKFFEASSVPIDLIILLDTSASMRPRMETVHKAALGFLKTLRPGDRGAVVSFNDSVEVLQSLTTDRSALETAVLGTVAGGGTALNTALYVSLKQFGRGVRPDGEIRRQAIALLSDGADTASGLSFDDVLELARTSGVNVYPIALVPERVGQRDPNEEDYSKVHYMMRQLAQETGAQAFFPATIAALAGVYSSIAQELSSQYSLAYDSTNTRPDGQFRHIVIKMISRPELKPRARPGYVVGLARPSI